MIKTINSNFANRSGTISKMFLRVINIDVSFSEGHQIIIEFEYYTKCEAQNIEISQERGNIFMEFNEADNMTSFVANKYEIQIGSNFYKSLKKLLPFVLIEYQLTNIKNGLTPFNIPVDDWEIL